MLTVLGLGMILCFMYLIMSRRMTALAALTLIPILFALIAYGLGFYVDSLGHIEIKELGEMMLEGVKKLAPTGVMLLFAILYFAIMIDTGLFDPSVKFILRLVKGDPLKVVIGTITLTLIVSLDGDGSTTYMICVAAMLPLYKRLGMSPLIMACLMMLASGIMNLTPWGGPTARAASALHVEASDIFVPMVLPMLIAILWLYFVGFMYGRMERKRLGIIELDVSHGDDIQISTNPEANRAHLRWFNGLLTVVLMICLVKGVLPLPILFMIALCIALVVNYKDIDMQKSLVAHHAGSALNVVGIIFAAGIFTGILTGTGMVDAMSKELVAIIPQSMGPFLAPITAVISMPLTFFMSNDAFYYGVLPILSEAASHYGITPVEMARASIVGQPVHLLSPLVPSTYLLCGLAGIEFGQHQKFTIKWAILTCLVMLVAAMLLGVFPLYSTMH
ncbi:MULTISPECIES: CitMHS family transporter [Acinetobacter]|jgi:CitMHS family citrate-Mg2+:H+ or citrate-Ca2+:H+ symporter|uniref:CitMHS family transporter n=1 Tax=Acinetobacter bereziniae TaxID=106648 RepID=A0A3S0BDU2_ACIBZ|nr:MULTISPECIES: CitMHS family transporter [Acinetobacter]MEC8125141.1 CitMHS family transporter [Pseudomonadota bacterium]KKW80121.1 citrate transporter [Acinetobacter sp. Ag2]MBI0393298.1 CitMHS family transporter [Acinetobacter bereziniae]MBJ8421801.1 CitMHS family transporter [Acinetobacter bereziniae]MBJ8442650.1 CitMHS family transporter [Acinetobacter bereziniae]